jgi:hypothetical protein
MNLKNNVIVFASFFLLIFIIANCNTTLIMFSIYERHKHEIHCDVNQSEGSSYTLSANKAKESFWRYWKIFCYISHSDNFQGESWNKIPVCHWGKRFWFVEITPSATSSSFTERAQMGGRDWEWFSTAVLKRLIVCGPRVSTPSLLKPTDAAKVKW